MAKKATAVVQVVSSMAEAASGSTMAAISSVVADCLDKRSFFHLSTDTKISSAPNAVATKKPMKLRTGKLLSTRIISSLHKIFYSRSLININLQSKSYNEVINKIC